MSHTYTNLLYHIIFSTKERPPLIKVDQKEELHAYVASLVNEKGGKVLIINSMPDHVHILVMLPPNVSVSDLMKFVKANSSRWISRLSEIHSHGKKVSGHLVFQGRAFGGVAKYIRDQEIHHRNMDYRNEFVMFLKKNEVEFEAEFLWR